MFKTFSNNGQYNSYSNKCFFIALKDAMALKKITFDMDFWISESKLDPNEMFDNFKVNIFFIDNICECYQISIIFYNGKREVLARYKEYPTIIKILNSHNHFEAIDDTSEFVTKSLVAPKNELKNYKELTPKLFPNSTMLPKYPTSHKIEELKSVYNNNNNNIKTFGDVANLLNSDKDRRIDRDNLNKLIPLLDQLMRK